MNIFKKSKKQLGIFVTAGYPQLGSLEKHIQLLESKKIDFIEVGMPFSDPLADGPVIQKSSSIALQNGMNIELMFEQLHNINSSMPIVLMGYANPVLQFGLESFLEQCAILKIASVILPDISWEIYNRNYRSLFEFYSVPVSFLVTPNSTDQYIKEVSDYCCNSFVYLVSSNTTTGNNLTKKMDLEELNKIKLKCGVTPVFIGFGIDSKEKIEIVNTIADGAIIGSAYIKAIEKGNEKEFLNDITVEYIHEGVV